MGNIVTTLYVGPHVVYCCHQLVPVPDWHLQHRIKSHQHPQLLPFTVIAEHVDEEELWHLAEINLLCGSTQPAVPLKAALKALQFVWAAV